MKNLYKIQFLNQGEIYVVYAKNVAQSNLFGFIEIEEFVFDKKTEMVIDPGEERLKSEFNGVKRSYIPMQAILRIDEVSVQGTAKIIKENSQNNVRPFPGQVCVPSKERFP